MGDLVCSYGRISGGISGCVGVFHHGIVRLAGADQKTFTVDLFHQESDAAVIRDAEVRAELQGGFFRARVIEQCTLAGEQRFS